jgi:L-glyceraldehyde 3-phosphate reductase
MDYQPASTRYNNSNFYRNCGRSGLRLPAISLGLWHNFGAADVFEDARQVVRHAFDFGITHFDLANNYGPPPGSAEANFGRILKEDLAAYRDELIISTKAGYLMWSGPYGEWGSRKHVLSSLDQSLRRMGSDYVDIFYSHRPDPNTPLEETMGALAHAIKSGKALYAGLSNYDPKQTRQSVEILRALGAPCIVHQPRYNLFDRWVENGLLEVLASEGLGGIAFSPLAQGMLTEKYLQGIPQGSRASKDRGFLRPEHLTEEKLMKTRKLNELACARGQSLAQFALAWVLHNPQITSVLIGASNVTQIEENITAFECLNFSAEELRAIDAIVPA